MRYICLILLICFHLPASAQTEARYLANAGVMVTRGDSKILFDPLFRNDYGQYQLVPVAMQQALMDGEEPFDGVDAIFVSHYHGDHYAAMDILDYLLEHPSVLLFAPEQATMELQQMVGASNDALLERVHGLAVDYDKPAVSLAVHSLQIDAFAIPHAGWPDRMQEVQNIAFRVTLDDATTVLHLGDADTSPDHFAKDAELWGTTETDAAFPPYWFFTSSKGQAVLRDQLTPAMAIGVHVPGELPPAYSKGLEDADLFRVPGETRQIEK